MELKSRYGEVWNLEEIDKGYRLEFPGHTRVGFSEDNTIYFIDPPGGPFLSIGDFLGGKKITGFEDHGTHVLILT